jgi:hypothetical protein
MAPILDRIDAETSEVLAKLSDPNAQITKADGLTLDVAYLLLLREKKTRSATR